jgi:hypothetical protein
MVPGTELHFHTRSQTNMPEQNLTPEILAAALQGLEAQRARLDAHIAEVRRLLGARTHEPAAAAKAPRPRRRLSTAALKRIVEAQRKRWADYHQKKAEDVKKAEEPAAATKTPRPKRKMSAAGRKRIADATRKRWAEYNRKKAEAAQKTEEPAAVKKAAPKKAAAKTLKKAAKRTAKKTAAREPKTAVAAAATQPAVAEAASE